MALALASGIGAAPAKAAEIPWKTAKIRYVAEGKSLKEVLRDLAASQGITAAVAPEVEGSVNGRFNLTPQSFLDLLASSFGFIWYFDGSVMHVTPPSDVKTEVVRLTYATVPRLRDMLSRMHIDDPRFPLIYDASENTVVVSGPSRYVDLVTQVAHRLDDNQNQQQATEVRVFRLKNAWAADRTIQVGGKTVTIPGVATVMRGMYLGNPSSFSQNSPVDRIFPLSGIGRVASSSPAPGPKLPDLPTATMSEKNVQNPVRKEKSPEEGEVPPDMPTIRADTQLNAILVRDLPSRMASHAALIKSLDVRPSLIEIEARIIEIRSDDLKQLGIDWRLNNRRFDLQFTNPGNPALRFPGSLSTNASGIDASAPQFDPIAGGALTSVLGDAGRYLMARVSALSDDGRARITASPKVATLDNQEAVMDNTQTFFVRVAGYQTSELFNISVGTSLHVLPLVVDDPDGRKIKLSVRIEDGNITNQSVDQIPIIRRSEIGTQAFINEGEGLLIAGYSTDEDTSEEVAVPGLSKVPLLGGLFRHQENHRQKLERLFLLTPRIVVL
ncbi:MAG: type III secretion system outer membrane ring subunit SctC [Burkholderiaceae bacterium]